MCNKRRRNKDKRTVAVILGLLAAMLLIVVICSRESERPRREDFVPVTRVIKAGDTAWQIADEYCPETLDKREYLGWCEQLNGVDMGYIRVGEQVVFLECVR